MEPPKKRKYPDLEPVSGSCGLVGVARAEQQEEPGSSLQPAKRNRRSYSLEFKVQVLDSYYHDAQTKLNQRKTALKFGVNRRQIQKWLAQEDTLRGSVGAGYTQVLCSAPSVPQPVVQTRRRPLLGPSPG